ncbi:unnamed protein product [Brachionus calyciflorus]|uniref:PHD finger protein 14 n=1 Tax=Brachionus calyciflorus TaxID=104777 RepID=A0A813TUZ9_9BILA|nr:unnamed protein product [Brachionus calyciflorus]
MKPQRSSLVAQFASKLFNGDDGTESSSDEDFVCDEDESLNSDASSDDESDDEAEDESSNEESNDEEDKVESNQSDESDNLTPERTKKLQVAQTTTEKQVLKSNFAKPLKLPKLKNFNICCVCLNDENDSSDELISCDSCGFNTHEGCYGIADNGSIQSSDSTASTEPWFCNSCLIENRFEPRIVDQKGLICFNRSCELCPNTNCGLLKETENGKFVHILCALYTSGVAYQWPDRLWPVVLNEIPISNWGEQICTLCDNIRYSRTGVCIKCDAGMCKTYFHATCAQKHGYLVDPFQQQNTSDPFIAYCKSHNDPNIIKSRKANYYAMISSYKSKNLVDKRLFENETKENKERLMSKFKKAIEKYEFERDKLVSKPANLNKSKLLTTCPEILKCLILKNKMNDLAEINVDNQVHSTSTVTFTPDFVKYYFEREMKIPGYIRELELLKRSQFELTEQEAELRNKYEKTLGERKNLTETRKDLIDKLRLYSDLLKLVLSEDNYPSLFFKKILEEEPLEKIEEKAKIKTEPLNTSNIDNTSVKKRTRKESKSQFVTIDLSLDAECVICHLKTNSHLLIDCDTCKNVYHINCLDPPLSSVPKKTKLYGWECAKCVEKKSTSDVEDEIKTEELNDSVNKRPKRERKQRVLDDGDTSTSPKKRMRKNNSKTKLKKSNDDEIKIENLKNDEKNTSILEVTETEKTGQNANYSDSDAIYIDDDTQSPQKINPVISFDKKVTKYFKTLPFKETNSPRKSQDKLKSTKKNIKNDKSSDEIENDNKRSLSKSKSNDSLDEIFESVINSPNIQSSSRKNHINKKNKL